MSTYLAYINEIEEALGKDLCDEAMREAQLIVDRLRPKQLLSTKPDPILFLACIIKLLTGKRLAQATKETAN